MPSFKFLKLLIPLLVLNLSACSITEVVDYDDDNVPLEEQRRIMDKGGVEYTEDFVTLATENQIAIVASKKTPTLTFHRDYEIKQDNWSIDAHNLSDKGQCVVLQWKLMDFKFVSDHPSAFYVPQNGMLHVGTMTQMVWEMNGVKFAPEGSGFIWAMATRDPEPEAYEGDECIFYLREEDIRKEEDVYEH